MPELLICWVAYPLLLALVAHGCGVLVALAAGRPLPATVRLPCGIALAIAVLDIATYSTVTAPLAVWAVAALTVAGCVAGWLASPAGLRRPVGVASPAGRRRPSGATWSALAAALIAFAAYAAPIVLSGKATWGGYIKLDDTSTWLALVDRALTHGHSIAGLPPSTYQLTLAQYLAVGYPLGSFLPLGLGHVFLGQDVAWLSNPWMAFMGAMLALGLHRIATLTLPRGRSWQLAAIAGVGAMPALLYGYYLWGGMKEMAGAMLIAAFAVTAPLALTGAHRARALIPVLVVVWAMVAALSPGGLVWIAPGLAIAAALAAAVSWRDLRRVLRPAERKAAATRPPGDGAAVVGSSGGAVVGSSGGAVVGSSGGAVVGSSGGAVVGSSGGAVVGSSGGAVVGAGVVGVAGRPGALGLAGRPGVLGVARRPAVLWATGLAVAAALGVYLVFRPGGFVERFHDVLTSGTQLGNLVKPLSLQQLAGIWPTGDFRFAPHQLAITRVFEVLATAGAAGAVAIALARRRYELLLLLVCALTGAVIIDALASPWLGGKGLATGSIAIPFGALVTAGWLVQGDQGRLERVAGATLGLIVAGGVVWSNLLGYHAVNLAPRQLMSELSEIGGRIAGQGPTFMDEYSTYGDRHFLRDAAPESASEVRTRPDYLINGQLLPSGASIDIDGFALSTVLAYRTLVLQRSPSASRPPSPYRLIYQDQFWQVWQRPVLVNPPVLEHIALGTGLQAGSVPRCAGVLTLARRPGVAELVAPPVRNAVFAPASSGVHAARWSTSGPLLSLNGAGSATIPVSVPRSGRYEVWLGGSVRGAVTLLVEGARIGTVRDELQEPGQYIPFGVVHLDAGRHVVTLRYLGGGWRPGSGGPPAMVGPLAASLLAPPAPLLRVAPSQARSLCGRTLDWIETLGEPVP